MLTYGWLKLSSNQHRSPLKSSFLIPFQKHLIYPSLRPSFRPLLFKTHVLRSYTLSTNQLCFPSIHPLHFSSKFFFLSLLLTLSLILKVFPLPMFYRALDCRCVSVDTKLEIVPARLQYISLPGEREREKQAHCYVRHGASINAKMMNGWR